jgi:two-component system copper resistance phosphate regulon response regulator CusR
MSNVVDVYIQRLRRKLDARGSVSLIRTRRGEGYQLASEETGHGVTDLRSVEGR